MRVARTLATPRRLATSRMLATWLVACALLASGWLRPAGAAATVGGPAPTDCPTCANLYVVRRGWHIDVGFSSADLEPPLGSLLADFPRARFLIFGFGDRRYLLAKHRGGATLLAALWPGKSLILGTGLSASPDEAFGASHVVSIRVSRRQLRLAQAFVWHSLTQLPPGGAAAPYARGPYEGSLYFSSDATYSALHTCNTWAAELLAYAEVPVRSTGVLFAGQLWRQIRRLTGPGRATLPHASPDQQGGFEPF